MGLGVLCRISSLLNTIKTCQIRRPSFIYPRDRKALPQTAQFSKWLHRKSWSIMPDWILWIIPHNQSYLCCSQRGQCVLFALSVQALLHGMGLLHAPTQGFRGCLVLQPGSWWSWRLERRQQEKGRGFGNVYFLPLGRALLGSVGFFLFVLHSSTYHKHCKIK